MFLKSRKFLCLFLFLFCFFSTDTTVSLDSLYRHGNLVFGTWDRDPVDCSKKEAEAGGVTVLVLFAQISTVFILVVDMKLGPISTGENYLKTVPRAEPPHRLK